MTCGILFSILIFCVSPLTFAKNQDLSNASLLRLLHNRRGNWIALNGDLSLEFLTPQGKKVTCRAELVYQRLDEKILLKGFNEKNEPLFIFKTSDRNFELYLPLISEFYHGSIFDLEDSPEIQSHLKALDLYRALKPGGVLLIQEINCSLLMQWLLRVTHHEGFNFQCHVFDPREICTNPHDLWDANCAIPNLLFDDLEEFQRHVTDFALEEHGYDEVVIFPLSGGVIAKAPTVPLPRWLLRGVDHLDRGLIRLSTRIFPLQQHVALRKILS